MEQKDYILREIEKIGLMLRMWLERIQGKKEQSGVVREETGMKELSGWLLEETGCDLKEVQEREGSELDHYLSALKGFNCANTELLGDVLMTHGMQTEKREGEKYLRAALRLFELCNQMERAYSMERDDKIRSITHYLL